uniref:Uncharacterized protein n=1 Tax=Arundo donax TaxID=35708 RepID=A0A0A9D3Y5_ARUDO
MRLYVCSIHTLFCCSIYIFVHDLTENHPISCLLCLILLYNFIMFILCFLCGYEHFAIFSLAEPQRRGSAQLLLATMTCM